MSETEYTPPISERGGSKDSAVAVASLSLAAKTIGKRLPERKEIEASLREIALAETIVDRVCHFFDVGPERAGKILEVAADPASKSWKRARGLPVSAYEIEGGARVASADCRLILLEPGRSFPRHCHHGEEWCFALSGSAQEDGGAALSAGDMTLRPSGSRHSLRTVGGAAFVYAQVLYGSIELEEA